MIPSVVSPLELIDRIKVISITYVLQHTRRASWSMIFFAFARTSSNDVTRSTFCRWPKAITRSSSVSTWPPTPMAITCISNNWGKWSSIITSLVLVVLSLHSMQAKFWDGANHLSVMAERIMNWSRAALSVQQNPCVILAEWPIRRASFDKGKAN